MKKIAIVANLPLWEASPHPSTPNDAWHYCVWLSALRKLMDRQNEFHIHWVIPNKEIKTKTVVETENQTFHLIPKTKLTIGLYSGYIYDTYHILNVLRHISPDLVHSWGTEDSHSLAASHYTGKKLLSIQGLLTAYAKRARLARFERHQALYEPYTIRKFEHITTESPWAEHQVRELSAKPVFHHLEYAVEERFFSISRQLTDTPTCLYAGTNVPVKNLPTLIKAFSDPVLAHVQLQLAGVMPDEFPNLPSNIRPLGRLNRDAMVHQLSQTWALVHPSLADTGPTIAKEARVMGVPVMLTSPCGSKQHVEDGKSGFVVEPYDTTAMKEAVLRMTESAETALSMGRHSQEECRQKLSADTMINNLLGIYREILD